MKSILFFLILNSSILLAQPPLPPVPAGLVMIVEPNPAHRTNYVTPYYTGTNYFVAVSNKVSRTPAFSVACPHCKLKLTGYHALSVQTNGWHSIAGGNVCERTIYFVCPNMDCHQQFTAKNERFVPDVIAVEDGVD